METLTLKTIEKLLDKKFDEKLKPIKVTLDSHGKKLDEHSKVLEEHTEILNYHTEILVEHSKTLKKHSDILERHSGLLDGLVTDVKNLDDHKTVYSYRLEHLEGWAKDAGKNIGLKFEL